MDEPENNDRKILRLDTAVDEQKRKARMRQLNRPLHLADLEPYLEQIEVLQGEVQALQATVVKLIRLLKQSQEK
jgi:hypothetical protein